MDLKRLTDAVLRKHLELDSPSKPELRIQAFAYESVYTELQAICAALGPKDKVWICDKASRALMQVLPKVGESCSLKKICFCSLLVIFNNISNKKIKDADFLCLFRVKIPSAC